MRPELLSELSAIGYEVLPEDENIRLRYRNPGDPPETAKQLIEELKKSKAEVLSLLKHPAGKRQQPVSPGAPQVMKVWKNPHKQGTPAARRESLRLIMEESLQKAMDDIQAGGRWKATPEVRALEDEIDQTYVKILAGQDNLQDFISLIAQWKVAGSQQSECREEGGVNA